MSVKSEEKSERTEPCEHPCQRGRRSSGCPSRDSPAALEDTTVEQVFSLRTAACGDGRAEKRELCGSHKLRIAHILGFVTSHMNSP